MNIFTRMKNLLTLIILLPLFSFGQIAPQLTKARHTFSLNGNSLTVFQEATFFSIVDWYSIADTVRTLNDTLFLSFYYEPQGVGNFPYLSTTLDTISINNLSTGNYTLIVNSHEWWEFKDSSSNWSFIYALRDSDTSHFQVLSDKNYVLDEPLQFYPNPAKQQLSVKGIKPEEGTLSIQINDVHGKVVLKELISNQNPALSIGSLPTGTYLLQYQRNGLPINQKILIE